MLSEQITLILTFAVIFPKPLLIPMLKGPLLSLNQNAADEAIKGSRASILLISFTHLTSNHA